MSDLIAVLGFFLALAVIAAVLAWRGQLTVSLRKKPASNG